MEETLRAMNGRKRGRKKAGSNTNDGGENWNHWYQAQVREWDRAQGEETESEIETETKTETETGTEIETETDTEGDTEDEEGNSKGSNHPTKTGPNDRGLSPTKGPVTDGKKRKSSGGGKGNANKKSRTRGRKNTSKKGKVPPNGGRTAAKEAPSKKTAGKATTSTAKKGQP